MPIYEVSDTEIRPVGETSFARAGMRERQDPQRLLRENIEILAPGTMLIAAEFGAFEGSARRIDLLGFDSDVNLVVIELKRTEDGDQRDLQAIRYAAMVSTMTFDHVVDALVADAESHGRELEEEEARSQILDFLGWDELDEPSFATSV